MQHKMIDYILVGSVITGFKKLSIVNGLFYRILNL